MSAPEDANGKAGASARREHERRRAKRETRVREHHPRIGGLILALSDPPQSETSWERGGVGEELVEQALADRCPTVIILHDRRIPGTRRNIDHIAIAPTGVWVIDTKRYQGKVEVVTPWFGKPKLMIRGRDHTKLVAGLLDQIERVKEALGLDHPQAPVQGCFCFVEAELPLFSIPSISGLLVLGRKRLAKRLNADGPVTAEQQAGIATRLRERFPSA